LPHNLGIEADSRMKGEIATVGFAERDRGDETAV